MALIVAPEHMKEIKEQCELLEANGIIEESSSPWASPILMVPKPSREGKKEWRMCIDYRGLNARTVKDKYTVPSLRDIYRNLRGNKIFSSFDLRSGYYHIPIKKEDQEKTAFITETGKLYQWKRMAFGFVNAPAVFQRCMNQMFQHLDFVIVYIDDIIICSKTEEEHAEHLKQVFEVLKKWNLKLRIEKCMFFQQEIKYLGIWITPNGIKADQGYIDQVLKFKVPENSKEVERYLGMIMWLGRFIPNLSKLTASISSLKNKKGPDFIWGETQQESFEAIQRAISNTKTLRHPDFTKEFYVQTDASDYAIGAVLLQDFGNGYLEPIEFGSRKFITAERNWHASEKELIAVVWALKKWIRYLLPNQFTVFTDHKNLENLFNKDTTKMGKLARWIIFLQQFDFIAKYLPGKDNYIADYLSRDIQGIVTKKVMQQIEATRGEMLVIATPNHPHNRDIQEAQLIGPGLIPERRSARLAQKVAVDYDEATDNTHHGRKYKNPTMFPPIGHQDGEHTNLSKQALNLLQEPNWTITSEELKTEQNKEERWNAIIRQLQNPGTSIHGISTKDITKIQDKGYLLNRNGILFRDDTKQPVVPIFPKSLTLKILSYFHTANAFHHQGINRTTHTIRQHFFWPDIRAAVQAFVGKCHHCKLSNAKQEAAKGKRGGIITEKPFEMIACDLVGPLPLTASNHRYILTIMDKYTRYVEAIPLQEITATTVAQAIIDHWYYRYGAPRKILSDNGTQFASNVFKIVNDTLGIKAKFSTPYHPQCNGMIERFHRFLKQRLAIKASAHDLDYWNTDSWDTYLSSITFAYNNTVHTITKHAPFELLYGKKARLTIQVPNIEVKAGFKTYEEYLLDFIKGLGILRNKSFADEYRRHVEAIAKANKDRSSYSYQVGDFVSKKTFLTGNKSKLGFRFIGPYEIKRIEENGITFHIQNIHTNVEEKIHGELLAKYQSIHGTSKPVTVPPPNDLIKSQDHIVSKIASIFKINLNENNQGTHQS